MSDPGATLPRMIRTSQRCSSCGGVEQLFLVTALIFGEDTPGRLLWYCRPCRYKVQASERSLEVAIPLELVDEHVFVRLYELKLTASSPPQACEIVFGEVNERIARRAQGFVDGIDEPSPHPDPAHPVEVLFKRLRDFGHYPDGVLPIGGRVGGVGFFPGGSGLWGAARDHALPAMPIGKVMVLGHNLDSETTFNTALDNDGENLKSATWRALAKTLPAAGVPLEDCFFTNFFMGLVKGSISTGAFPGANDAEFVARCRAFFVEQLKALQPRVVIVLGVQTPRHLAAVAPELARWERVRTFKHLDESGAALVKAAHVPGVDAAFSAVVVAHPSLGFANRRHRKFNGLIGDVAEAALIAAALA